MVTDGEKEVAQVLEAILQRNRIDSMNIERGNLLFAGCEVATVWYATEEQNLLYGVDSRLKIRCKNYSPTLNDALYPFFDEYGDMVAMSFGYKRKQGDEDVEYFDVYTIDEHLRYVNRSGWTEDIREKTTLGKIPAVYCYRCSPAWEDTSGIVTEIEWALSRNGNYLRRNSKPMLGLFTEEEIPTGQSNDNSALDVFQFPKGSDARYITWQQAVENLKFYISELRQSFFSQLQLPDMSYESMKTTPMSGEARKMMFIDAQLKVKDESGRLLEMLDRELNVVKAFVKIILPQRAADVDTLQIETTITPFTITDDKDTIDNIMSATGGKAIMSQREGVEFLEWSTDVDATMKQLAEGAMVDVMEPTE